MDGLVYYRTEYMYRLDLHCLGLLTPPLRYFKICATWRPHCVAHTTLRRRIRTRPRKRPDPATCGPPDVCGNAGMPPTSFDRNERLPAMAVALSVEVSTKKGHPAGGGRPSPNTGVGAPMLADFTLHMIRSSGNHGCRGCVHDGRRTPRPATSPCRSRAAAETPGRASEAEGGQA